MTGEGSGRPRGPGGSRQLVLDLAREPSFERDEFLVSSSNAVAFAAVEGWPAWPRRVMLLKGPPGSGKSHLAAIWAARAGARIIAADESSLPGDGREPIVALVEDCGKVAYDQAFLFHLVNAVGETGGSLLMTCASMPPAWGIGVPDLLSRLRLADVAEIHRPDAELIKAVIVKLFADRQIRIDEDVVNYAALHCDQSLDAIGGFVAAVDEDALAAGRRITRPLAIQTMARLASRWTPSDPPQGPT